MVVAYKLTDAAPKNPLIYSCSAHRYCGSDWSISPLAWHKRGHVLTQSALAYDGQKAELSALGIFSALIDSCSGCPRLRRGQGGGQRPRELSEFDYGFVGNKPWLDSLCFQRKPSLFEVWFLPNSAVLATSALRDG